MEYRALGRAPEERLGAGLALPGNSPTASALGHLPGQDLFVHQPAEELWGVQGREGREDTVIFHALLIMGQVAEKSSVPPRKTFRVKGSCCLLTVPEP